MRRNRQAQYDKWKPFTNTSLGFWNEFRM